MEKISIIIIALLSLSIISCNPDYTKAQELEGIWEVTEVKDGTIVTTYPYTLLGITHSSSMRFHDIKEDAGKVTFTYKVGNISNEDTKDFSITDKGTKIIVDTEKYDFTVNGKDLIFQNDDISTTLKKQ